MQYLVQMLTIFHKVQHVFNLFYIKKIHIPEEVQMELRQVSKWRMLWVTACNRFFKY